MHATGRTETGQGKSVHRFIARSALGRFWRSGSGLFLGTAIRLTNSETPKFICFRRWESSALWRKNDLAEFAYNGDRSRMERDIENLERQGLAEVKAILGTEHNPIKVVTLTKEGNKLLRQAEILESPQRTYHGLKKPKEAAHDADLYRLYHKVSDEIESQGGRVVGVRLDYELKDELYSRIARASKSRHGSQQAIREEIAERFYLKVVNGKIPIPDLRIEYVNENDGRLQRRDLELATDHYRPRGLSEKARAGFELYARRDDADRLRRVRDREELMTTILRM
jgi:hypothetical protein